MEQKKIISKRRLKFLRAQGYNKIGDVRLSNLAIGNRFAFQLCCIILIFGVATASIPILMVMGIVAFLGVVLPYHPFDYVYNKIIRRKLKKPKLPPRSMQLKFACAVATVWIEIVIFLFYSEMFIAAYFTGSVLVSMAALVSITDICVPSLLYNVIIKPGSSNH